MNDKFKVRILARMSCADFPPCIGEAQIVTEDFPSRIFWCGLFYYKTETGKKDMILMNKRNWSTALLSTLLCTSILFSGCNGNNQANTSGTSAQKEPTENSFVSSAVESKRPAEDRAGTPIVIPEKIERIISLAPSITQVLCEVGVGDKLIAVDTNSPSYAEGIPSNAVSLDLLSPDNEKILELSPDIILASTMSAKGGDDPFTGVRNAGICVVNIPTSDTIQDVQLDVQFIADCVDKSEEGKKLVENMQKKKEEVSAIGAGITEKKSVLFEISAAPSIYSFGRGVFLNEMIELIGARNIFDDQEGWIAASEESIVERNPDVILTSVNYIDDPVGEIKGRPGWEGVAAIQNGTIFMVDNGTSTLPNHHIVEAMLQMAKAVYPEQYSEIQ